VAIGEETLRGYDILLQDISFQDVNDILKAPVKISIPIKILKFVKVSTPSFKGNYFNIN
jgi:hypothetical protein